jgi:hypothetical protein
MKLFMAAPANFFSVAWALQVGLCALALVARKTSAIATTANFMSASLLQHQFRRV